MQQQQQQQTSVVALWRLAAINELHHMRQGVGKQPLLRNTLERKMYESLIETEILILEAAGYRVFLREGEDAYQCQHRREEGEGEQAS